MWLPLALLCAFLVGSGDVLSKVALRKSHEGIVGFSRLLFSLPVLGIVVGFRGVPVLGASFWRTLMILLPFELAAYLLYLRAIRIASLSLTVPFLALTPVFTILTSFLLLGEKISFWGGMGIVIITIGAYLIHLDTVQEGWMAPLRAIFRERGSCLMIIAAFLYSITSNLGKQAIRLSDPYTFAFFYPLVNGIALFLAMSWQGKRKQFSLRKEVLSQWPLYALLGGVMALAFLAHCVAIASIEVPYFIAIKRTSLLVGVLYGGFLLKEKRMFQRFWGTACMVMGVLLIAFSAKFF